MLQRDRAETQPCYTEIARPKWRNGRRAGLKNRWENIPCQFESDLRHQFPDFLLKSGSEWGRFRCFADQIHNCRPQSAAFPGTKRASIGINKRDQIAGVQASDLFSYPQHVDKSCSQPHHSGILPRPASTRCPRKPATNPGGPLRAIWTTAFHGAFPIPYLFLFADQRTPHLQSLRRETTQLG